MYPYEDQEMGEQEEEEKREVQELQYNTSRRMWNIESKQHRNSIQTFFFCVRPCDSVRQYVGPSVFVDRIVYLSCW